MTGLYSMSLSGGAALAAGLTLPVASAVGLDWRGALATWGVLAVAGALVWGPRALRASLPGTTGFRALPNPDGRGSVWRSPLAWAVTAVMGTQSLSFYATSAWLPEIFVSHGLSPEAGGWMLALCNLVGIAGSFVTPVVAGRMRRQRGVGVVLVVLVGGGLLGLALVLMALRARDAAHTSELSGMAQSAGYVLAACGPLGVGLAHDASGAWTLPLLLLVVVAAAQGVAVWFAGRDAHVR